MTTSARPCPPLPPLNLHGKEGVDGSSPSEGFAARANAARDRDTLRCASAADFGEEVRELARLVGPEPFAGEELAGNHQCIARLGGDHSAVPLGSANDAGDADRDPGRNCDVLVAAQLLDP